MYNNAIKGDLRPDLVCHVAGLTDAGRVLFKCNTLTGLARRNPVRYDGPVSLQADAAFLTEANAVSVFFWSLLAGESFRAKKLSPVNVGDVLEYPARRLVIRHVSLGFKILRLSRVG